METYKEALNWIHGRLKFGSRPGLSRVTYLLERLGNPHLDLDVVHIGGTNGKGSTVAFLNGLLLAQGLKVGTFTSPFITRFNERISLNGEAITDEALLKLVQRIYPFVSEMDQLAEVSGITEFELITVLMFLYFKEEQVDIALVEVGLGGLYDSTNVIETPLVSVITTIGMDHMAILGETLEKIAAQKAGIIKKQAPVVIGRLPAEALAVIEEVATKKQAPCYIIGQAFDYQAADLDHFDFSMKDISFKGLEKTLRGHHQFDNAAVALATFCLLKEPLGLTLSLEKIKAGLAQVSWPGRMEVISQKPFVLIDGAHNEPAVTELVNNIAREFSDKKVKLLFAAINTKDIEPMLRLLRDHLGSENVFYTTFSDPRALPLTAYEELGIDQQQLLADWESGLTALQASLLADEVLIVTGSLYFISDVRKKLLKEI